MPKTLSVVPQETILTTAQGSYYVRKLKNGWSVYHQSYKDGRKTDTKVEKLAYHELGFRLDWSLDQARERCKRLNKEKSITQAKARKAAARLMELQSLDSVLFQEDAVSAFSRKLEQENEGSENHLRKMSSHFLKIQALITDLKILPHEYKENEKLIYKWFARNRVSLDYTQKLISLLNRWGAFVSRRDGRFFEPISPVRGISREKIRDSHEDKKGVRRESKPISPLLLQNKKNLLSEANYNFLFITVWFGLRPSEVSKIDEVVTKLNDDGTEFLIVYQSKLAAVEKSRRYKAIPILFDEQKTAVEYLKSKKIKAPIYKKMLSVFGESYGLYGGRKGFTDLMLSKGYSLEDISLWLGHTSIETTWAHYKNKNSLSLPTPKVK